MEKMNPTPEQVEASEDILAKARANRKLSYGASWLVSS